MKNVLNYFVRKAFGFKSTATAEDKTLFGHLLRIRQNIQGVYDWLCARCPADAWWLARRMPMTEAVVDPNGNMGAEPLRLRPVLQNSDNLLAHLRLLDNRKITNGYADGTPADDGLPDGVSLARLLCDSTTQPTALIDDNVGWVMSKNLPTNFPLVERLVLGCKTVRNYPSGAYLPTNLTSIEFPELESWEVTYEYRPLFIYNNEHITELTFPKAKAIGMGFSYDSTGAEGTFIHGCKNLKRVSFPELHTFGIGLADDAYGNAYNILIKNCESLEEVYMPKWSGAISWRIVRGCPNLKKLVLGHITSGVPALYSSTAYPFNSCTNLLHLEIQGASVSLDFRSWSPTLDSSNLSLFLDNFLHFIAERVAEGNYTLTLSAAVYAALEQQEGQTILALLNTKGWTVAQA